MLLSVEISMYPFKGDYIPAIRAYIEKLNQYEDLEVETFPTSTVIMGEYDRVMSIISDSVKWSFEHYGKAVFVTKLIPEYQAFK